MDPGGEEELVQHLGVDPEQSLALVDKTCLLHLNRRADECGCIHLSVSGLQAVESTFLDGVLKVLHFLIMGFEFTAELHQLIKELR